ncbi:MAG: enterochelin esterase [Planctomycetes bacterium]|nr:enterochelin esterase [Planctomycetota bacterium]
MDGPSWFGTEPFFGLDVKDWKPGEALQFDPEKAIGYPSPLAELPAGRYRLQAVIDLNGWSHDVAGAPGNGYSEIQTLEHDPEQPTALHLEIAKTVPVRELKDTESTKFIRLKSRLLSEFYHHDVYLRAAVGFPDSYDEDKQKRYPAVYTIPGFGGTINNAGRGVRSSEYAADGFEPIVIFLDPDCPTGHHVFADSANNGPRGQALIEELIPYLEREFRLIPEVGARFVTGHSSGGWSSLWLQVAYPDTFGGVWSGSPDPVDFTAFQTIDIYDEKENMFTLADGSPRPLSRGDWGSPLLTKSFCLMEETVGRGGQLQSFEAVFSPRGPDGRPRQLWNRQTGKLDAAVAQAWRRYDIREIVAHDWSRLGPKLKGKLHLFCGDKDTFLLEGAFFKLRDALERLGSDAYVEVIPGAGHGLPPSVHRKMVEQMAASAAANATHRK